MSYFDEPARLWQSITKKPARVSVKFGSLRPGRDFYSTVSGGARATKTLQIKANVKSGFTNARDGNFFFYVDPESSVWVQP